MSFTDPGHEVLYPFVNLRRWFDHVLKHPEFSVILVSMGDVDAATENLLKEAFGDQDPYPESDPSDTHVRAVSLNETDNAMPHTHAKTSRSVGKLAKVSKNDDLQLSCPDCESQVIRKTRGNIFLKNMQPAFMDATTKNFVERASETVCPQQNVAQDPSRNTAMKNPGVDLFIDECKQSPDVHKILHEYSHEES